MSGSTWLTTLTPGCQVRICTATTTRALDLDDATPKTTEQS